MPNFDKILQKSEDLAHLKAKARTITMLADKLSSLIPELTEFPCQVANVRNGTLVLIVSSPAYKHKLRYLEPHILKKLHTTPEWCYIRKILVKIDTLQTTIQVIQDHKNPPHISANTHSSIKNLKETVCDPELKLALDKLQKSLPYPATK